MFHDFQRSVTTISGLPVMSLVECKKKKPRRYKAVDNLTS